MTMVMDRQTAVAPSVLAINSFGERTDAMLPESGWSLGHATTKDQVASNVYLTSWYDMTDSAEFNYGVAHELNIAGVTADQFYEAWNLMGSVAFTLEVKLAERDPMYVTLKAALEDTTATKDLRLAYHLVLPTLRVELAEACRLARRIGYNDFFRYAMKGLTAEQIRDMDENEIDPELVESFLAWAD